MSLLPFSIFKQGNTQYEVVDKKARDDIDALKTISTPFTQLATFSAGNISKSGDLSAYNEIVICLAYGNLRKYVYLGKGTIDIDKYVQLYLFETVPVIANIIISNTYYGINGIFINNQSGDSNPDWIVTVYGR